MKLANHMPVLLCMGILLSGCNPVSQMNAGKPIDAFQARTNQNAPDAVQPEQNGVFPEIIHLRFESVQVHELVEKEDEFVIQFPGLHLQLPNITVLTWSQEKHLAAAKVITGSLFQGNRFFAEISKDSDPPLISIGYFDHQNTVFHPYRYDGKRLVRFGLK